MASFAFKAGEDYALKLSRLAAQSDAVAARAIAKAAGIVADQVRRNLENLAEDAHYSNQHPDYYFLTETQTFTGIPTYQKQDLLDSFGISPVTVDKNGDYNAKLGFDGYGSQPTAAYPQGLPNQLAARATESGTSIRPKQPFVRPAVKATKQKAKEAMQEVIDAAIAETMK